MTTTATEPKSWSDMTDKERAAWRRKQAADGRKAAKLGMANPTTAAALVAELAAQAPDGWTVTLGTGWTDGHESYEEGFAANMFNVVFVRDFCKVALNVVAVDATRKANSFGGSWDREHAFRGCTVAGHTLANGCSFTRYGVDAASCGLTAAGKDAYNDDRTSLASLLDSQYERCRASVERSKTALGVPGLPYSRQPDWFAKAAVDIKAGKSVRLAPHGMGTGHVISRRQDRFASTRADAKLETLLGHAPLYVTTFDHD